MKDTKDILLGKLRDGETMTSYQQTRLALMLSIPAIFAQLSSVLMQYIDAAMVGHLGSGPAASIGLIMTSTWITGGFTMGLSSGFTVQVAHRCGAKEFDKARKISREGMMAGIIFNILLAATCIAIAFPLPHWLGGSPEICTDASNYFWIYSCFMPIGAVGWVASMMIQASGNMKAPSIMFISMCMLDVVFNYIFIYIFDMGVIGAALGTGIAESVTSIWSVWYLLVKSKELRYTGEKVSWWPRRKTLRTAWGITAPMWLQNIIMRGAHVMSTVIVAPLGDIAIAANAFAITAESFCYMPGYGIEEAATSLVGQSIGARRKDLAKRFTNITVMLAAGIMSALAVVMYILAPTMMEMLTKDPSIIALGAKVLRIEAFAETMYAVSMVAYGACVGAGNTKIPTMLNFLSMWVVRIGLAAILTPRMGLTGYWIAMCIELNFRGIIFLIHTRGTKWMKEV